MKKLLLILFLGSIAAFAQDTNEITRYRTVKHKEQRTKPEVQSTTNVVSLVMTSETNGVDDVIALKTKKSFSTGIAVGKVVDYFDEPVLQAKVVFFSTNYYKEMKTTPGGNFGFSVIESNDYTITVSIGNQFFYTNFFAYPGGTFFVLAKLKTPLTVLGKISIDGKPAQFGILMRIISKYGKHAGGLVLSNGLFKIVNVTPSDYTVVLERRKRFIDKRINESRFYYFPLSLTSETVNISITRERTSLSGEVTLDDLPRRYVNGLVVLKDAKTDGMLIHREAYLYYRKGFFIFDNVQPGAYTLQALSVNGEWKSEVIPVVVKEGKRFKKIEIDVITDKDAHKRRLWQIRHQFMKE